MNKLVLFFLFISSIGYAQENARFLTRQGEVTFFSYTSVENIQASNNQVFSVMEPATSKIAVRILMRAFVFKKSLMHEHFNESYVESDLYPEATFNGMIMEFDPMATETQTRLLKGDFTLRNVTKSIAFKAEISPNAIGTYTVEGTLEVQVKDYDIKVPPLLSPNIAKNIQISFKFEFEPHEK